jgi:hypothetical protein
MQNFGQINETFKNIFLDSLIAKDGKGKKIFKSYVKFIKENSILKSQYEVYHRLENKVNIEGDMERSSMYVDECISMLTKLGRDAVNETNNKLVKYLKKNDYKIYTDEYDFKSLHEHINNVAFLERNTKNVNTVVESKLFLKDFSNINETTETQEVEPYANKLLIPLMKNKFNEKYGVNLSELEKKIFSLSVKGTDEERQELYTTTINECVDLVNVQLKECSIEQKDTLLQVKDKLLRSKYDTETFAAEMSNINYLKTTLN